MKKNIYIVPKIKVKPIDSEEILAGAGSIEINTTGPEVEVVDDGQQEVNSKSNSMFDTDNDQLWK